MPFSNQLKWKERLDLYKRYFLADKGNLSLGCQNSGDNVQVLIIKIKDFYVKIYFM